MEKLSLFRAVSNAAVSGILSHTQSDGAETLLVGWAGKKKSLVLLMWYFAIRSATLLRLFYQWLPSGMMAFKACLAAANNCQQPKENFKKRTGEKTWNQVPTCSTQKAAESPAACGAQGGGFSPENLQKKVLRHIAESKLATLFPPLALSYLLITFGFYFLTFKYAE